MQLYPYSSNVNKQCESFIKSKNVECLLEEYLQMKVKGLSNLDGPRMVFYMFSLPGNFLS